MLNFDRQKLENHYFQLNQRETVPVVSYLSCCFRLSFNESRRNGHLAWG